MKRLTPVMLLLSIILVAGSSAFAHEKSPADKSTPPLSSQEIIPGTGFEGRVVVDGAVIAGSRVYAYRSFADFIESKPFAASALTTDDGK